MGWDPNQNQLILSSVIFGIFATLAVVIRLYIRKKKAGKWTIDDHFATATGIFFLAYAGLVIHAALEGATGLDPAGFDYPTVVRALKLWIAETNIVTATIALARISVILLYYRLFFVYHRFGLFIKMMGVLSILWTIIILAALNFKCNPIAKTWDPKLPGSCLDVGVLFVAAESTNILLDAVLVISPTTVIRHLTMESREKVALSLLFACGGFVCVSGIVRILLVYNPDSDVACKSLVSPIHRVPTALAKFSDAYTNWNFWTLLQLFFAVVCACVPTYGPLVRSLPTILRQVRSVFAPQSHIDTYSSGGIAISDEDENCGRDWYGHKNRSSTKENNYRLDTIDIEMKGNGVGSGGRDHARTQRPGVDQ